MAENAYFPGQKQMNYQVSNIINFMSNITFDFTLGSMNQTTSAAGINNNPAKTNETPIVNELRRSSG